MKTITREQLVDMRKNQENLIVINVLDPEAFDKRHIPESVNVPVSRGNFTEAVEEIAGGKDRPVVVYCANTECDASPTAARKLETAGFTDVYDYEGGIKDWDQAGLPVASGDVVR